MTVNSLSLLHLIKQQPWLSLPLSLYLLPSLSRGLTGREWGEVRKKEKEKVNWVADWIQKHGH